MVTSSKSSAAWFRQHTQVDVLQALYMIMFDVQPPCVCTFVHVVENKRLAIRRPYGHNLRWSIGTLVHEELLVRPPTPAVAQLRNATSESKWYQEEMTDPCFGNFMRHSMHAEG